MNKDVKCEAQISYMMILGWSQMPWDVWTHFKIVSRVATLNGHQMPSFFCTGLTQVHVEKGCSHVITMMEWKRTPKQ